jgi:uncharacterized protein (TIGR03083 family)
MAAHPEVDESIRRTRAVSQRLRAEVLNLPPEAWDTPTNCPPWPVRRLVAHMVENGNFVRGNVEGGIAGRLELSESQEQRAARLQRIAAAPPAEVAATLDQITADLEATLERLSADQLEALCFHPAGNRPARWYAVQRLIELTMHYWDLDRSLGRDATIDEDVARFVLPVILESNLPRTYQRGPKGEGRVRLVVEGAPQQSWLLTATPEALRVERGGDGADLTVTAPAALLALMVYGRASPLEAEGQGRARVEGDRALAERFTTIFPGP